MSVEREQRILDLLDQALEKPPPERQEFLDEACGDDTLMREGVEALLDTEIDGLLAAPAFSVHDDDADVGRRIGPYQLVRLLDRGGMGSVYLAKREDFEQRVALKLIRRGLDADEVLVRRFENERQILARLDHPHIARLLDGGTTEDRLPYFVMEYVEGEPIDRYCRGHELPVRERLELFRRVCAAVQFAHQNLVIHRDLKPSNILISKNRHPRLLDFGIAKLLDDSMAPNAVETVLGEGAMTPRYASPEQIRLKPVTTASDVYSLGVLLYELLTGLDPYGVGRRRGDEIARAVCEQEPDRPSTAVRRRSAEPEAAETRRLRRRLAGDLDSIVLKAMRKEPGERYASAEQLSEDIRRHLMGLPVDAQTGTFRYRAGKFVRRHRLGMGVAAAFLVLILGFTVVSTVLWRAAESERRKAVTALSILESFIESGDPDKTGRRDLTVIEALQRGLQQALEQLSSEAVGLRIDVAGRLGRVLHKAGAYAESKRMMQQSLQAARLRHGELHPEVARRLNNLAVLLFEHEEYRQAEVRFRQVLQMRRSLGQDAPSLFRSKSNLAMAILRQGRLDEAEELCAEVLEARRVRYKDRRRDTDVATSSHNLAAVYYAQGSLEKAEPLLREALETRRIRLGPQKTSVATVLDLLGNVLAATGHEYEAEELLGEALAIRSALLGKESLKASETRKNLALLLADGAPGTAMEHATRALEVFSRVRPKGWDAAEAKSILGMILVASERYGEAESYLTEGYDRMVELRGNQTYRSLLAFERIVELYESWGRPEKLERYQGETHSPQGERRDLSKPAGDGPR